MTFRLCASVLIVLLGIVTGCTHTTRVRIYVSDPKKGGLVRAQAGELVPYSSTGGYFCTPGDDLEVLLLEALPPEEE